MTALPVIRSDEPRSIIVGMAGLPVAKARPRAYVDDKTGNLRLRTPKKTRAYERALALAAMVAMRGGKPKLAGPLTMLILAFVDIPSSWPKWKRAAALAGIIRPESKPDFDNLIKIAADALKGVVYRDDAQVVDGRVVKLYSDQPRIAIKVSEWRHSELDDLRLAMQLTEAP